MAKAKGHKRDLERARREKAQAKEARKVQRRDDAAAAAAAPPPDTTDYSEADLLEQLAELHRQHADEQLDQDEFETARDEVLRQLRIS